MMVRHENNLSKYATKSEQAIRLNEENLDNEIRPAFFHDIDRIIYSLAYTRYIDKTQVFSLKENDHISKRIIHVQFVSKIAKTIGRVLGLNEDLIEAIALGHDLGHVPFGHTGEAILNELSLKYDNTYFNHNVQSVRLLMEIEKKGQGSNLTLQTLDGILCHNGEFCMEEYKPMNKDKELFLKQYNDCYIEKSAIKRLIPMTLEGCVVRLCDIIAYIGRDIEDAIRLGVLTKEEIPESISSILGTTNSEIVNTIILDVIENSNNKLYIKMSKKVFEALSELKDFNYKHIYNKANTKEQLEEYKKMFTILFETYLNQIKNKEIKEDIFQVFLNDMNENYLNNNSDARKVIDFIAGMTDDYFINQYNKYRNYNK